MIIIAIAVVVSRFLRRLIDRMRDFKRLSPIMAGRSPTFRHWTILSLAVLILMQVVGVFGSAWTLISAGLAAVALGFVAAWSMLSNATAALLILTLRPFRLGDSVDLVEPNGTGIGGCVVDLTLMYTTLKLPQYIHIPNNFFSKDPTNALVTRAREQSHVLRQGGRLVRLESSADTSPHARSKLLPHDCRPRFGGVVYFNLRWALSRDG